MSTAIWKKVAPNFLLSNGLGDYDYYFGICLEQAKNVERALGKSDFNELYELIRGLPENYLIEFMYIDTYKPKEVSWPLLFKKVVSLSGEDVKWFIKYSKENDWKTRMLIMRKVWKKREILSRSEHKKRVEK
ncbi:MAG: hypothetical protein QXQ92_06530 [Candidatus Nezhaarchaeales archaeon]